MPKFGYQGARTAASLPPLPSFPVHAFNNRSTKQSVFKLGLFSNKILLSAVIFSFILQIFVTQTFIGNSIFKTQAMPLSLWIIVVSTAGLPLVFVEIKKLLRPKFLP